MKLSCDKQDLTMDEVMCVVNALEETFGNLCGFFSISTLIKL